MMARTPSMADRLKAQKARLAELREERPGQTLKWWAERYGIEYQTFKKVAGGERPIQNDDALAIANHHDVDVTSLLFAEAGQRPVALQSQSGEATVPLLGWVSAGSTVLKTPLHESVVDQVTAAPGSTDKTRALEIRGDSLGELFDRWIVYFDDEQRPVSPDLINRLCIVALVDDRVLVKKIARAAKGIGYDLLSNTEKPIRNVQIKWAARVKHMAPR